MDHTTAGNRWETYAFTYDNEAPRAVPCYRHLHAEVVRRVRFPSAQPLVVADLGAGGGRLLETLLTRYPRARAVWVDSSTVMRVIAGRRLARFNGRVVWREGAMERVDWEKEAPEGYDAVVSSVAMHH
ncbi:MAG: class I SAM-dependent methyltransferase, partial [Armatimonadota bacterium]|nr:class I SAM-dependent methyltransferase [Armatimonadota bacterium]